MTFNLFYLYVVLKCTYVSREAIYLLYCVARIGEIGNAYNILIGKREGKRPLG